MKIPISPQVRSAPIGAAKVGVNPDGAFGEEIGQAVERFGGNVSQMGHALNYEVQKERHKADTIKSTGSLTELKRRVDGGMVGNGQAMKDGDHVPGQWGMDLEEDSGEEYAPNGFLRLNGEAAAKASAGTLAYFEKSRKEIAEKLSPRQRQMFDQAADQLMLDNKRQVEMHVGAQIEVAKRGALKAGWEEALKAATTNYADGETADTQLNSMVGPIRALQESEAHGTMQIAELRSTLIAARLGKFLEEEDGQGAAKLFEASKKDLAPKAAEFFGQKIASVNRETEAESIAQRLMQVPELQKEQGKVDEQRAFEEIDKHIPETRADLRQEAKRRFKERAVTSERQYDEETKGISKNAFSAYNTGGWRGIPGPLKDELNKRNPELYNRLQEDSERKWKQRNQSSAENARAQTLADRMAMLEFMGHPPDERVKLDLPVTFAGSGVSPLMLKTISNHQQRDKEGIAKGEGVREADFVTGVRAQAQGIVAKKEDLKEFEAEARIEYSRFVQDHKRAPTRQEELDMGVGLVKDRVIKGRFWDSKEKEYKARADERKAASKNPAPEVRREAAPKNLDEQTTKRIGNKEFIRNASGRWVPKSQ